MGHSGRGWVALLGKLFGPVLPPPEEVSAPYMVPALELRRLLGQARAWGEPFTVQYRRFLHNRTLAFSRRGRFPGVVRERKAAATAAAVAAGAAGASSSEAEEQQSSEMK